jgi:Tfp pilus assembly protein PilN
VELGYDSIVGKLAQLLGVSPSEAEEYLRTEPVDITIPEDEIDPTEDNRMREALLSVFSGFVSELIRSIRYYESQAQRADRVGKLLLFGNMKLFPNLDKYLEDQTGLEVNLVNFGSLVQYRQGVYSLDILAEHSSKLVTSAGLAMEAFRKKKELNLMPPSYYTKAVNLNILKGALVLFAVLGGLAYMQKTKYDAAIALKTGEATKAESEAQAVKPDADQFDQVKSEIQAQLPRFNQIFNLLGSQRVWPEIMDELGNRTNDQVWMESVDFEAKSNTLVLKGIGVSRTDILQFCINLDKSPFFTNTNFKDTTDKGGAGGGGGGGGGGGRGPSTTGSGTASMPAPNGNLLGGAPKMNSAEPMQNYQLPRFDFTPGASIEDFFRNDYSDTYPDYIWKFEITTTLQTEIVNQQLNDDFSQIKELINDVVNT